MYFYLFFPSLLRSCTQNLTFCCHNRSLGRTTSGHETLSSLALRFPGLSIYLSFSLSLFLSLYSACPPPFLIFPVGRVEPTCHSCANTSVLGFLMMPTADSLINISVLLPVDLCRLRRVLVLDSSACSGHCLVSREEPEGAGWVGFKEVTRKDIQASQVPR